MRVDYDVFICYRGDFDSGCQLGERIRAKIDEKKMFRCFYSPIILPHGMSFVDDIPKIMEHVKVVVLMLSPDFYKKTKEFDPVIFELKNALKNPKTMFLPIYFEGFSYKTEDLSDFTEDEIKRLKYISPINYHGIYSDNLNYEIMPNLENLLKGGVSFDELSAPGGKDYFVYDKEQEYMNNQQNMLNDYDNEVREPLLAGVKSVLDVGCNDGINIFNNFYKKADISVIVGIDFQEDCIRKANADRPEDVHFYVCDLESPDLEKRITEIEKEVGISGFDLINIQMVLLHLKNPRNVLKILRKHLSKNGLVFIRDIDDDFNFFYPDPDGILRNYQSMAPHLLSWGYRGSGKKVYSYLKLAGFSKVEIKKQGLNTAGMSYDERETLFNVYFGDIAYCAKLTSKAYPDSTYLAREAEWAEEYLDDALMLFHRDDFVFSLGYIIYVARK